MARLDKVIQYLKSYYTQYSREGSEGFFISVNSAVWSDRFVSWEELEQGGIKLTESELKSADVYHSIFAFKQGTARKTEFASTRTNYLVFDIEKQGHQEADDEELRAVARELIEFFAQRGIDSAVKLSGRGLHLYIKVKIDLTDKRHFKLYKKIREYISVILKEGWVSDNIADSTRVIRVAHSINQKAGKTAVFYNKSISELEEVEFDKLYAVYQELKQKFEEEKKAKQEAEKEFEDSHIIELDDDRLSELAKELALLLKDIWVQGLRHNLSIAVAGFIRKQTALSEEQARELFEMMLSLLSDDEVDDRLRVVKDTYSKDIKSVASVSILLKKTESGYELTDVGRQLAVTLRLSDEEAVELIRKLFEDMRELFNKFAIARLKKNLVGRVFIDKSDKRLVAVEVYRDRVVVAYYVRQANSISRVRESVVINSSIRLKNALILIDDNSEEERYTIEFKSQLRSFEVREKTIREIAEQLENSVITSSKSRQELMRVLQTVIFILMKTYNIRYKKLYSSFEVQFRDNKYEMTESFINSDRETVIDIYELDSKLTVEDFQKLCEVLADIRDDKLLFVLAGQVFSAPFTQETRLKPLIWIWSHEGGVGKSTVTSKLLEKLFMLDAKSVDSLGSENTPYRFLIAAQHRLPLVIDDVERIPASFMGILKAYATGVENYFRGTGKVKKDIKMRTRANLIITANRPFLLDSESVMSRIINVQVTQKTLIHSYAVELIDELGEGVGYLIYKLMLDNLNSKQERFSDIVKLISKTITADIDYRRKLIYSQLLAGLTVFYRIVREVADKSLDWRAQRLAERLWRIINEDYNKLIEELEDEQAVFVSGDTIISAVEFVIRSELALYKEDELLNKKFYYITALAFKKMKEKDTSGVLDGITSVWALMKEINKIAEKNSFKKKIATKTRVRDEVTKKYVDAVRIDREALEELKLKIYNPAEYERRFKQEAGIDKFVSMSSP